MSISPAGVFNLLVFASFFLAGVLVFFLTGVFPRMCSSATPLSAKPWGLRRSLFWKRCSTHQRHWQLQTNTQRQRQMQIIDKQNLKHYRQKQYFFQTQFCLGQVNCVQTNDKHNYDHNVILNTTVRNHLYFKIQFLCCRSGELSVGVQTNEHNYEQNNSKLNATDTT